MECSRIMFNEHHRGYMGLEYRCYICMWRRLLIATKQYCWWKYNSQLQQYFRLLGVSRSHNKAVTTVLFFSNISGTSCHNNVLKIWKIVLNIIYVWCWTFH